MKREPIDIWRGLIWDPAEDARAKQTFRRIYLDHCPDIAEIVLNGVCPHRCRHCIYPPDYHVCNPTLTPQRWQAGLHRLYHELGMRRFIFCGRSVQRRQMQIIQAFKQHAPDAEIGLIMDGPNLAQHLDAILALKPGWLDISIDGLQTSHDHQRRQPGAFQQTAALLDHLSRIRHGI